MDPAPGQELGAGVGRAPDAGVPAPPRLGDPPLESDSEVRSRLPARRARARHGARERLSVGERIVPHAGVDGDALDGAGAEHLRGDRLHGADLQRICRTDGDFHGFNIATEITEDTEKHYFRQFK